MNYTKPNDKNYQDRPEDWLFAALTFSAALGYVIPEGKGIVIDVKGDMVDLHPTTKRVIVYNGGERMEIIDASEREGLKEGESVFIIPGEDISN